MSSARYERLDSDESRLPDGMQRIGYDADEQRYTYQDADGSLWEGGEGQEYGRLHRVGHRPTTSVPDAATSASLHAANERAAWRYMFPFLLLVGVFLLFMYRITHPSKPDWAAPPVCDIDEQTYQIVNGDTCWELAERWGVSVDDLLDSNEDLDCDKLQVGRQICVPKGKEEGFGRL